MCTVVGWVPYILGVGLCASTVAGAPPPQQPPRQSERMEDDMPASLRRTGDQITLKSGKVLHGVKITRRTALNLVLETLPGVKPLVIPIRQVESIEYGALNSRPTEIERPTQPPVPVAAPPQASATDVLQAVRLSPELIEKMARPFTDEPIEFENQDIVTILHSVSILSRVPISLDAAINHLPTDQRRATLELPAGTSFDDFLETKFGPELPWLRAEFRFDRLHFALIGSRPDGGVDSVEDSKTEESRGINAGLQ